MIDRMDEHVDECKGRIRCRPEYFAAVTLDRERSFPHLAVGHRARGTLREAAGRSQRPVLVVQGGAKVGARVDSQIGERVCCRA